MRLAKIATVGLPLVLGFALGALFTGQPSATAQDAKASASGLDGVSKAALILSNGSREEGPIKLVSVGDEPFLHVTNKNGDRMLNLEHVVYIIPK